MYKPKLQLYNTEKNTLEVWKRELNLFFDKLDLSGLDVTNTIIETITSQVIEKIGQGVVIMYTDITIEGVSDTLTFNLSAI